MIKFADTSPKVDVAPAEYKRLLGYPADFEFADRSAELAELARAWYAEHGRPWVYARQSDRLELAHGRVGIDGVWFESERLFATLAQAQADAVVLVAVSAGPELEQHAQQLWLEEKPDEYFFLEVYGSAVVEHLVTMKGAELCAWADGCGQAILPHYSPGYPEWEISQQSALLRLICEDEAEHFPGQLDALDSGMLRPKKSLLAVFGVTRHRDRVARLVDLNPCESCSYLACQYRRAPYRGATRSFNRDEIAQTKRILSQLLPEALSLARNADYSVSPKALARWAHNRLTLVERENGTIDALFRYEGTTCSNLGRPLFFDYRVTLGPRENGYILCAMSCQAASGDEGHRSMCRYLESPTQLMSAIEREKPLLGEPLNSVLAWDAARSAAGCYCELGDRLHKWRLVLETIHFALVERDARVPIAAANGVP
ncbi:MAG: hypothetical protein AB7G28_15660 [Pirellulales bacterium]